MIRNQEEFVGGAVLGTAFSAVYAGIEGLIVKNHLFKDHFKNIKSELDHLMPLLTAVTGMPLSNKQLSFTNSDGLRCLEQVLKAGEEVVLECSNVSRPSFSVLYRSERKLIKLRDLVILFKLLLRVQIFSSSNDDDSSSTTTEPNGRPKLVITSWVKGALLGSGSFGSLYEGISDEGFFIAVKEVSLLDQVRVTQLEQEIALLSRFEHENIVQYYGTQKDESKLYIFLELVTEGSLQKLYQTYHLRDSHVSVFTRQILQGLKYLHDQNVIHRDIKRANILVHANGSVKLADFGMAKTSRLNDIKSFKGTFKWMAPEVVNSSKGYGLPADIWSLGCTVLEMLTGQVPYPNLEPVPALWEIAQGKPPQVPDSLSKGAQDFIHLCLQVKPDDRPTAAQLLKHPFLNKSLPPAPSGSVSPYNQHRQREKDLFSYKLNKCSAINTWLTLIELH